MTDEKRQPQHCTFAPGHDLICGRCYDTVDQLFAPRCAEKPEDLAGQPIGQYHCPDCGAMILAGVKHPWLCARCLDHRHPWLDGPVANQD